MPTIQKIRENTVREFADFLKSEGLCMEMFEGETIRYINVDEMERYLEKFVKEVM